MSKYKVEILVDFKHQGTDYFAGETIFTDETEAAYFCQASWARDPSGKYETGAPNKEVRLADVATVRISAKGVQ